MDTPLPQTNPNTTQTPSGIPTGSSQPSPVSAQQPQSASTPTAAAPSSNSTQGPFPSNSLATPPHIMNGNFSPHDASTPPGIEEEHTGIPTFLKIAIGLIVFFVIILLILVFFSMRKNSNGSGNVTLTYWGLWEDKSVMASILNDFTKQYPNITVNYIQQDPKQYTERLITRIQGGNGPDVFRFHNSWLPFLQPLMSPLAKETIDPKDFTTNYYPVIKTDLTRNGAIYGVPLEIDTLSLFVNTSLLQNAGVSVPTNWNDFVTDSRTLTVVDANNKIKTAGAALGTYDNITHAPDILSMLFAQSNVNLVDLTKNAQNASDALSFYTSFATGKTAVWDSSQDPSITAFAKGNLAMYFGYSWDVFQIKAINPSLQFSIYSVPHLPGTKQTTASYWAEGISSKSKHQKEAQLLLAYLAKKETMQKLYTEESKIRLFGEPYPRIDLASGLKGNQYLEPIVAAAPDAVSSYFVGDTYDTAVNIPLDNYLADAVRGVLANTSPESALTTLSQGTAQILSRYGIK